MIVFICLVTSLWVCGWFEIIHPFTVEHWSTCRDCDRLFARWPFVFFRLYSHHDFLFVTDCTVHGDLLFPTHCTRWPFVSYIVDCTLWPFVSYRLYMVNWWSFVSYWLCTLWPFFSYRLYTVTFCFLQIVHCAFLFPTDCIQSPFVSYRLYTVTFCFL